MNRLVLFTVALLGWAAGATSFGQPSPQGNEDEKNYVTRYQVWGASAKSSGERPWSESFESRDAAEKRLREIEQDYARGGLMEYAPDPPKGLYVKEIKVSTFRGTRPPRRPQENNEPRPAGRPGGGAGDDNEDAHKDGGKSDSRWEPPFGERGDSKPQGDSKAGQAEANGKWTREENGVISVGRRPDGRRAEAPGAYVVWEVTADGKKVLRCMTKNAKEAQLAREEIERAGGRAYRKEFGAWNEATLVVAKEFKIITMPEKKWITVDTPPEKKWTTVDTPKARNDGTYDDTQPNGAAKVELEGTAWGDNNVRIKLNRRGVLEHMDPYNNREPFLRGTWKSTGSDSFSGEAYRPTNAGGFDLAIEVAGKMVGGKLRVETKTKRVNRELISEGHNGVFEDRFDFDYTRK